MLRVVHAFDVKPGVIEESFIEWLDSTASDTFRAWLRTAERLTILNAKDGVWRCRTVFNCVEACPRDIDVAGAISQVKKALLFNKV